MIYIYADVSKGASTKILQVLSNGLEAAFLPFKHVIVPHPPPLVDGNYTFFPCFKSSETFGGRINALLSFLR